MLVDTEDLVTQFEISQRCGVWPSAVSNWIKRYEDFPKPVYTHGNGKHRLYSWKAVKEFVSQPREHTVKTLGPLYKGDSL